MNMRKGLTLIELLIVVTIIAILAGAAIPYVQDYVEEARRSRCRNDIDEVVKALSLYELRRSTDYTMDNIASLVGPFLQRAVIDPWGAPFVINVSSSTVYSLGPDGTDETGDEITQYFRPRMAATKMVYRDINDNGVVDPGTDKILVYFTRPVLGTSPGLAAGPAAGSFVTSWAADDLGAGVITPFSKKVVSFDFATAFTPGSDTVTIIDTIPPDINDMSGDAALNFPKSDAFKVQAE